MKYRVLASLASVTALALGGGVAEAHNTRFQTSVELLVGVKLGPGQAILGGQVSSPRAQCVSNRTVRVFAIENGSRELVDIDRTSDKGAFAGIGDFWNANEVLAKVTRKNIGRSGHRHICGGARASKNLNNNGM